MDHPARPIAIFDSGLGGLTVAAEIHRRLPAEDLLFLADRARVPYASLSIPLIARFASECFDFLLAHDPKVVVIACNTVSSVSLQELAARSPVPVIGVIEPTARAAAAATKSGMIGVLATKATVRRQAYDEALKHLNPRASVFSNAAPLLVPLVEEGWTQGDIPRQVVEYYVAPLRAAQVDTLVLGCTHYEYFLHEFQTILGPKVSIINTPHETATLLENLLHHERLFESHQSHGTVTIYATDVTDALERVVAELFLQSEFPNQITIHSAQVPPQRPHSGS